MTSSLRAIRLGLKAQLEQAIAGLRVYDTWPTTINPPVAVVRPLSGMYDEDLDGSVTYQLELTLLLQLGNLTVAQEQLDAYIGTEGDLSIANALDSDGTLGGIAHSTRVDGWHDYGTMRVGADENGAAPEFMGVRFDVEVLS